MANYSTLPLWQEYLGQRVRNWPNLSPKKAPLLWPWCCYYNSAMACFKHVYEVFDSCPAKRKKKLSNSTTLKDGLIWVTYFKWKDVAEVTLHDFSDAVIRDDTVSLSLFLSLSLLCLSLSASPSYSPLHAHYHAMRKPSIHMKRPCVSRYSSSKGSWTQTDHHYQLRAGRWVFGWSQNSYIWTTPANAKVSKEVLSLMRFAQIIDSYTQEICRC